MKKLTWLAVCLFLTSALLAAVTNTPTQVSLVWNYPVAALSTDTVFVFYATNNLAAPLASWPYFTNVWATNYTDANLNPTNLDGTNGVFRLPFLTLPGQGFYTGKATNLWGESDFSTVASTPPVPRSDANLRLTRP